MVSYPQRWHLAPQCIFGALRLNPLHYHHLDVLLPSLTADPLVIVVVSPLPPVCCLPDSRSTHSGPRHRGLQRDQLGVAVICQITFEEIIMVEN